GLDVGPQVGRDIVIGEAEEPRGPPHARSAHAASRRRRMRGFEHPNGLADDRHPAPVALGTDLSVELGGIVAPLTDALLKMRAVAVQLARRRRTRLALGKCSGPGPSDHGLPAEADLAGDRALGDAALVELHHLTVALEPPLAA